MDKEMEWRTAIEKVTVYVPSYTGYSDIYDVDYDEAINYLVEVSPKAIIEWFGIWGPGIIYNTDDGAGHIIFEGGLN